MFSLKLTMPMSVKHVEMMLFFLCVCSFRLLLTDLVFWQNRKEI